MPGNTKKELIAKQDTPSRTPLTDHDKHDTPDSDDEMDDGFESDRDVHAEDEERHRARMEERRDRRVRIRREMRRGRASEGEERGTSEEGA